MWKKTKGLLLLICISFVTCYFNAPIFTPSNFNAVYFNLVYITNEYDTGGGCQLTGIIITTNHVLTCAHGCRPGKMKGIVRYREGVKEVPMKVVKIDIEDDLAVLRFEPPFDRKPTVIAEKVVWGEPVIFGGFNALKTPVLRFGFATMNDKGTMARPVWYGDSGSPMVNTKNELIGIIYRMDIATHQPYTPYVFTLVGYATPLEKIREFLTN